MKGTPVGTQGTPVGTPNRRRAVVAVTAAALAVPGAAEAETLVVTKTAAKGKGSPAIGLAVKKEATKRDQRGVKRGKEPGLGGVRAIVTARGRCHLAALVLALALPLALPTTGARGAEFEVTASKAYGAGTFTAAVKRANRSDGHDRIVFAARIARARLPGRVVVSGPLTMAGDGSGLRHRDPPTTLVASRESSFIYSQLRERSKLAVRHLRLERVSLAVRVDTVVDDVHMAGGGETNWPGLLAWRTGDLDIRDSVITRYEAGVQADSSVDVRRSVIAGNRRGGVTVEPRAGDVGFLWVSESLVVGNVKRVATGDGLGGGVALIGPGRGGVRNSTVVDNEVRGEGARGGGIYGPLTLRHVTVARNSAPVAGGAYLAGSKRPRIQNSLFDDNAGGSCGGDVLSQGGNVVDDEGGACEFGSGDLLETEPLLAPIDNNGGPTPTMALRNGSPALGFAVRENSTKRDQRGVKRGKNPDSGAFERR